MFCKSFEFDVALFHLPLSSYFVFVLQPMEWVGARCAFAPKRYSSIGDACPKVKES